MMSVVLCTIVTCIWGFINVQRVHHVSYDIQIQSQTDISGLNIVMFSDLHLGSVGSEDRLDKIVDEINHLEPDILCIAGDFFDTEFSSIQNPEKAIQTLRKIRTTYGVYACLGNHDAGKTFPQMTDFIEKANIQLLNDEAVVIDERLVLVGRVDGSPIGGYGTLQRKDFTQILTPEMKNLPVVVLDHNPANINEYGEDADLILCGHTHKGQLFPANLITKVMYTVDYGYYQKDAKKLEESFETKRMYVSERLTGIFIKQLLLENKRALFLPIAYLESKEKLSNAIDNVKKELKLRKQQGKKDIRSFLYAFRPLIIKVLPKFLVSAYRNR